uniref:Secreted protein n=1 Tax=Angiostrongylus cantonensis TaxID=6313 RepID=A0A0K0D3Y1_ANGCA
MLTLMHAVNMYAFQLDIRITVVDVVLIHGHNVTLEQFMEWRHTTGHLHGEKASFAFLMPIPFQPTHDLAILVRHRYEGGIAYVNGVCKRTAVGITGV